MDFDHYLNCVCIDEMDNIFENNFPFQNINDHFLTTGFDRFFYGLNINQKKQVYEKINKEFSIANKNLFFLFLRSIQCIIYFNLDENEMFTVLNELYYKAHYLSICGIKNDYTNTFHKDNFEIIIEVFIKFLNTILHKYNNIELLVKTILSIFK